MIQWIEGHDQLEKAQKKNRDFLVLLFYGAFSSASKRALAELEQFSKEYEKIPVYVVDVQKVKGVHKKFGVENVPTVLGIRKGKVSHELEGVESTQFYARVFSGANTPHYKSDKGSVSHRVIVYSGPGCPACGSAKAYLRGMGINFREVDISRDQSAAQSLVRRSGQMAVPQIDIDGHLIVGFDKPKINNMLAS